MAVILKFANFRVRSPQKQLVFNFKLDMHSNGGYFPFKNILSITIGSNHLSSSLIVDIRQENIQISSRSLPSRKCLGHVGNFISLSNLRYNNICIQLDVNQSISIVIWLNESVNRAENLHPYLMHQDFQVKLDSRNYFGSYFF